MGQVKKKFYELWSFPVIFGLLPGTTLQKKVCSRLLERLFRLPAAGTGPGRRGSARGCASPSPPSPVMGTAVKGSLLWQSAFWGVAIPIGCWTAAALKWWLRRGFAEPLAEPRRPGPVPAAAFPIMVEANRWKRAIHHLPREGEWESLVGNLCTRLRRWNEWYIGCS